MATAVTGSDVVSPAESGDVGATIEERLQAWKHLVGNIESFVEHHESMHKTIAKEFEKIRKTIEHPLKQAEMFTQETGGVQSLFENLRLNTQALTHLHHETGKTLKSGVAPQLERLHHEIKAKQKELHSGATKGTKAVAKARESSKKHVDHLAAIAGQQESASGKASKLHDPADDPYILKKGVLHRLHKQVLDENTHRSDLLAVQSGFKAFEAHVIQTLQYCMNEFYTAEAAQADKAKALYGDMVGATGKLPVDFEWNAFVSRYGHILIDPTKPPREASQISFPNQDHPYTKALIEGSLQRKGKILGRYSTAYFVVTPSRYLHEFENNDNTAKDPDPELSLFLPECKIGALSPAPDAKFTLSGKDANKNQKLTREHDFVFKASSWEEGKKWWDILAEQCGVRTGEVAAATPIPTRENTLQSNGTSPTTATATEKMEKLSVNTDAPATVTDQPVVASPTATP